ncbi:MAG: glycosyl hydrolase family 28-related protein, partial [bacterium]|nr:glycosyl hydrolase family 28-related protein [bacterium]
NPNAHPNIPNCSYAGYWHGERALTNAAGWTVFNVRNAPYNAYGDGVHDDSLAVWKALRAATNANGSVVYFPAGTYLLSTQLVITSSKVLLRGDGTNTTVLRFTKSLRDLYGGWWSYDGGLILFDGNGASANPYIAITTTPTEPQRGNFTLPLATVSGLVSGQFYQIKLTGTGGYDHTIATELLGNPAWASAYFSANPNDQANINITRPHQIIGINAGAKTVTLKEPLRFACRGIWLPELRALAAPLSECGVEQLTVALARNYPWYTTNHTFEVGWNGVKFDSVINGFVRYVEVLDPDGLALILMYSNNITVTDVRIRASAATRQRHHYATLLGNSHDCLLENIVVDSFPWHGLAMDQYSSGNAYSRCRLNAQGTLEYHGTLAYQNIRTEITLHNSGLHSGPAGSQPAIGGRTAHWNIDGQFSGPLVCVSDPSVLVQGALVGVQNMQVPAVTGTYNVRGYYGQYGTSGCAVEDSGLNGMVPAPANLYEAQKALRFGQPIPLGNGGGSTPTGNDVPYTFAFPGAVTGAYLAGQDNWLTPDANRGFGILTNIAHPAGMVMAGAGDPAKESLVARQYDARWHATPFFGSETRATFACDINFASSAGGINVGLMSSSTEDGVLIIANPNDKWYLRRAIYGTLFATNANPGPFSAG